jgi:transposase InsO family protein
LLWSFVYLVVRNLFALMWSLARPRRSKELEILVLQHELAGFPVKPETLLRRPIVHDRDSKFSHAFDEIHRTEGIRVIRTPAQAPNANAHAERWVRTVRTDCLDRILILGRRHLEHVLRVCRQHYNEHRPH